ncbi:TetR/AcrR family transcriptional regulator [Fodinicola acaciae]|uniref:TetR/AcrR family transcriptional regulator n=1 Tax=Fodinicola acaciae TaxID=2681555 RepID=UPI0013D35E77|nr:TetR/AcrR family transcriptional regulator [Fodinicola acaciae]
MGLREEKKQRTREQIAMAAYDLFVAHGFEAVRVVDVARQAGVSEATLFNYFPTKEDLVLGDLGSYVDSMVAAVRDRAAGQTLVEAFAAYVDRRDGLLPDSGERLATISGMIARSPTLLARERQLYDEYADVLAGLVARETKAKAADPRPHLVAYALVGLHRTLVNTVRTQLLAGRSPTTASRAARRQLATALPLLTSAFADYLAQSDGRER